MFLRKYYTLCKISLRTLLTCTSTRNDTGIYFQEQIASEKKMITGAIDQQQSGAAACVRIAYKPSCEKNTWEKKQNKNTTYTGYISEIQLESRSV